MSGKARTSQTHPLRIDAVTVPNTRGLIGMTSCPGRRDDLALAGPWRRNLADDLTVIAQWRPDMVITLVETHEFALLGVPDFAQAARARFVTWRQLPIVDGGVPGAAFERDWKTVGAQARAALVGGGRVLLHCRGGLGRTGMIAACLLVELGSTPDDAIMLVRIGHPSRIETYIQEQYVRAQSPIVGDIDRTRIPDAAVESGAPRRNAAPAPRAQE